MSFHIQNKWYNVSMELKDLYAKKLDKKSLAECGAHVYETMESKWFETNKASVSTLASKSELGW